MTDIRSAARNAATAVLAYAKAPGATIALADLYAACDADNAIAQNGVRWAVLDAKLAGIITKTDARGVYAFAA